jgi:hypothetical protein
MPFLVNPEQLRHIEAKNTRNLFFLQSSLDPALPRKRDMFAVKLYGEKSWFCLVFDGEDNTVNAKAQSLVQCDSARGGILPGEVIQLFIHDNR